ncbi:MAG TPA: MFS transporter, partial [Desulfosporosinus sp.]|nr:MFS transporter [Desulfosporosinus sp.]
MNETKRRNILLVGIILGLFFAALDQTIVGTALPRIIGDLGGLNILTWVTTAYLLTSTTVVPIAGKLGDLFGRRSIYIIGISLFMIGSALCGTSQNMTQLIIFRGIQGLGGGILIPFAMIVIGDIFPPHQRGKWQGVIGAVFGFSSIIGPTVGGWIVDHTTWRYVFYINLPVGILAAVAIYIGLHGEKRRKDKVVIDYAGTGTLIVGIVSLLLGLSLGGKDYPWGSWQIIALLSTAVVFIVTFVFIEKNASEPILSLDLFKNKVFVVTNMVGFLMGIG